MKERMHELAGLGAFAAASRARARSAAGIKACSAKWYAIASAMPVPATTKVFTDHTGTRRHSDPSP